MGMFMMSRCIMLLKEIFTADQLQVYQELNRGE